MHGEEEGLLEVPAVVCRMVLRTDAASECGYVCVLHVHENSTDRAGM